MENKMKKYEFTKERGKVNKMSSYEYNHKYVKKYLNKFDRIDLKVPKGRRQVIKEHATKRGESVNEFINRVIDAEIGRE